MESLDSWIVASSNLRFLILISGFYMCLPLISFKKVILINCPAWPNLWQVPKDPSPRYLPHLSFKNAFDDTKNHRPKNSLLMIIFNPTRKFTYELLLKIVFLTRFEDFISSLICPCHDPCPPWHLFTPRPWLVTLLKTFVSYLCANLSYFSLNVILLRYLIFEGFQRILMAASTTFL